MSCVTQAGEYLVLPTRGIEVASLLAVMRDEGKRLGRKCFGLGICIVYIAARCASLIASYNILKTLTSEF